MTLGHPGTLVKYTFRTIQDSLYTKDMSMDFAANISILNFDVLLNIDNDITESVNTRVHYFYFDESSTTLHDIRTKHLIKQVKKSKVFLVDQEDTTNVDYVTKVFVSVQEDGQWMGMKEADCYFDRNSSLAQIQLQSFFNESGRTFIRFTQNFNVSNQFRANMYEVYNSSVVSCATNKNFIAEVMSGFEPQTLELPVNMVFVCVYAVGTNRNIRSSPTVLIADYLKESAPTLPTNQVAVIVVSVIAAVIVLFVFIWCCLKQCVRIRKHFETFVLLEAECESDIEQTRRDSTREEETQTDSAVESTDDGFGSEQRCASSESNVAYSQTLDTRLPEADGGAHADRQNTSSCLYCRDYRSLDLDLNGIRFSLEASSYNCIAYCSQSTDNNSKCTDNTSKCTDNSSECTDNSSKYTDNSSNSTYNKSNCTDISGDCNDNSSANIDHSSKSCNNNIINDNERSNTNDIITTDLSGELSSYQKLTSRHPTNISRECTSAENNLKLDNFTFDWSEFDTSREQFTENSDC